MIDIIGWITSFLRSLFGPTNRTEQINSKGVNVGGDVTGSVTVNNSYPASPLIEVKMQGFTFTEGRLNLTFQNSSSTATVVRKVELAGTVLDSKPFVLPTSGVPMDRVYDVSGSAVLNKPDVSPELAVFYENPDGSVSTQKFEIIRGFRKDGRYNIDDLKRK